MVPVPNRIHEVTFERVDYAAAFMAAVSRQAASPNAPLVDDLRVEVELLSPGARVYLSDDALLVAESAFGAVPRVSYDRAALPPAVRAATDLSQLVTAETILQRLSALYHGLRDPVVASRPA